MKQYRVLFSPRAEQQLGDLYSYIADRSGEERADRFISGIVTFCQNLSIFPERGTKRDDLRPGLRIIGFARRVTIAFSVGGDRVMIHGIFYGGQDYEAVMEEDEP
ncbi:type II toxin-antitoxin system RelE/ParE family toxin [Aetokthonos hydrillicola Thurmond2011]|jgi:toxin ParE1/3/4|uniref:Type II toxin-antitoxin system RelE/ParE family toxin n=1 Tax=Aetokthonos hydrillicola Thurmond2011 TaxID=2712845 RepID=A0AAP5MD23_9CYAN|nr:type II toxin-antitoxin system RelE/ParE family toxin [Aetokthonos hydrillicola]MBO3462846.1 type II toxin-antitoxin system RelE/ParE family toxin [Aetokthonos hydrillicola CCALA 1050]MBW4590987.1 type II toxin-antitoxin system RelE/ParE family toxin [Aetokthonos hydrillicola CCALA 1050]MDR9899043.1 type II toxin-antitoxin system RelE/ParE family toxin [Aetokthonos hydrillicola Thurmond2011]